MAKKDFPPYMERIRMCMKWPRISAEVALNVSLGGESVQIKFGIEGTQKLNKHRGPELYVDISRGT